MANPMATQECCAHLYSVEFFENEQWHVAAFGDGSLMVFNRVDDAETTRQNLVENSRVKPIDTRITTWNRQAAFQLN